MRTNGVSWLVKDWIASVRFTLGTRSTMKTSTRSILAIASSAFLLCLARRVYAAASGSVSSTAWMRLMIALLVVS